MKDFSISLSFIAVLFCHSLAAQTRLALPEKLESQTLSQTEISIQTFPKTGKNLIWDYSSAHELFAPFPFILSLRKQNDTTFFLTYDGQDVEHSFIVGHQRYINYRENAQNRTRYLPPLPFACYPMSLNDRSQTELVGAWDDTRLFPIPLYGQYLSEMTGYGSLILPNQKIINDVCLIHTIIQWNDSASKLPAFKQERFAFYSNTSLTPLIEHRIYNDSIKHTYFYQTKDQHFSSFSNVEPVYKPMEGKPLSIVFPNPFRESVTIDLNLTQTQSVLVTLQNLKGQSLFQTQWEFPLAGNYRKTLNIEHLNLPKGTYILIIGSPEIQQTHKLQKH